MLLRHETSSIAKANDKLRSRGQVVRKDREDAGTFQSWIGFLVSPATS